MEPATEPPTTPARGIGLLLRGGIWLAVILTETLLLTLLNTLGGWKLRAGLLVLVLLGNLALWLWLRNRNQRRNIDKPSAAIPKADNLPPLDEAALSILCWLADKKWSATPQVLATKFGLDDDTVGEALEKLSALQLIKVERALTPYLKRDEFRATRRGRYYVREFRAQRS